METQTRIYQFFGSLPGLLVLAALTAAVILVAVLRRIRAQRASKAAPTSSGFAAAAEPAGQGRPPRWLLAAVASWAALEERPRPSASAWAPAADRADPWRIAGAQHSKTGVRQ
jgi:hypothetical protein